MDVRQSMKKAEIKEVVFQALVEQDYCSELALEDKEEHQAAFNIKRLEVEKEMKEMKEMDN